MIVNPFQNQSALVTYAGTRLLQQDFGLMGRQLRDPYDSLRTWEIHALFAPTGTRAVDGIRAKLVDQKQYVTFINQMDLEVLLGIGVPGKICRWSEKKYAGPNDHDFYGMFVDDDDLVDDLYERELLIRASCESHILPYGLEFTRRVHREEKVDVEELWALLWDGDPETGLSPDTRLETVERRWSRIECVRAPWDMAE